MNSIEPQTLHDLEGRTAGPQLGSAVATDARSRFKLWPLALIVMIIVALAFVAGYIPRWKQEKALIVETQALAIPTVTLVSPAPGIAPPNLTLPAEARPFVEAPIYARANGYLKRWHVDIGAQVKEGQLLAEIDTPELNQELERAKAELTQALAAMELAKTTAARWTELLKTASVSEQETAEKKADLSLKTATVEAARANVRRLEDLQSFNRVTAPFAGTITARRVDVGELINATGGRELFRLADTRTLRVYVRIPQSMARYVAPGLVADLTVQELPGRIFKAKVVRNSGAMEADSRTLLTELEVDNSKGEILAGSYVQVRFSDVKPEMALTLPPNTLLFRSEGPQVGVVDNNGHVTLHTVKLGRDYGRTIEILSGVTAQDQVILNPSDSLTSGTTVRVAQAEKAEK